MNERSITTQSEQETFAFAAEFLKHALDVAEEAHPLLLCLKGPLGGGKTQFVKGIVCSLGISRRITSPTFVFMKRFFIPATQAKCVEKGKKYFFHIDCYRISDETEARHIGLERVLGGSKNIVAVEWAERIEGILPRAHWEITFEHRGATKRRIRCYKRE